VSTEQETQRVKLTLNVVGWPSGLSSPVGIRSRRYGWVSSNPTPSLFSFVTSAIPEITCSPPCIFKTFTSIVLPMGNEVIIIGFSFFVNPRKREPTLIVARAAPAATIRSIYPSVRSCFSSAPIVYVIFLWCSGMIFSSEIDSRPSLKSTEDTFTSSASCQVLLNERLERPWCR